MKRTPAAAWLMYAAAGLLAVAFAGVLATLLAGADNEGVWIAAAVAYGLQLAAFALLLLVRNEPQLFLAGWLIGLVLRFAVLGAGAYALVKWPIFPRAAALLSYVAFVFILLLLEPMFLRWDLRKR